MRHPDQVRTCRQLVHAAWGYDVSEAEAATIVRSHIFRLRKKIELDPGNRSTSRPCAAAAISWRRRSSVGCGRAGRWARWARLSLTPALSRWERGRSGALRSRAFSAKPGFFCSQRRNVPADRTATNMHALPAAGLLDWGHESFESGSHVPK